MKITTEIITVELDFDEHEAIETTLNIVEKLLKAIPSGNPFSIKLSACFATLNNIYDDEIDNVRIIKN